jgi:superfamily II DNA or RNA helicase
MQLRDYQRAALDELYAWMRENDGHPCVVIPTGGGKSVIIAELCREAVTGWPETRILMLTHVKELIEQNAAKMLAMWPNAPLGIYSAGLRRKELGEPITFGGIQSLRGRADELGHVDLCIIDECHLVGHKDEGGYRDLLSELSRINPHLRIIGFTATPWRLGHGLITEKPAIFDGLLESVSIEELIHRGFLAPLRSKVTELEYDLTKVAKRGGEYVEGDLANAVDTVDQNNRVADEIIARAGDRRAWLLFCTGVDHARHMSEALSSNGIRSACVTGDTPPGERRQILDGFRSGHIRAVTNANVLTTGFDYPDIDLIAMLRPTLSPVLYCLDSETEILTPDGWARIGDKVERAAAFDVETGSVIWSDAIKMTRKREPGERMFSIRSSHQDIRVTENHRMVIKTRHEKPRLIEACELFQEQSIPCAGIQSAGGSGLTRDELVFLGLFLSDGALNKKTNAISISQGMRHPWIVEEIRRVLESCGMKYSERVTGRAGTKTNLGTRRFEQLAFVISKGAPRGTKKNLRGWGYLEKWITKSDLSVYESLTRAELKLFLLGLNMGDGSKHIGVDYTPRTYRIAMGLNVSLCDQLQSLCARRGMRSILSLGSCHMLHIATDKDSRSLLTKSSDSRPVFKAETDWVDEMVWCVEVSTGAIITRRNGRVAVMGNCQMAGRGLRLKSHTDHCLVLDFAGNVSTHGPITCVREPKKASDKKGDAPAKVCEQCGEIVALSVRECPSCGFAFPAPEAPQAKLRDDDIMGKDLSRSREVLDWRVSQHNSNGSGKEMVRIDYALADSSDRVSEFLCLRHGGYAQVKSEALLRQLSQAIGVEIDPLLPLDEIAHTLDSASPPLEIVYERQGEFFRVKSRKFAPPVAREAKPEEEDDDPIPF